MIFSQDDKFIERSLKGLLILCLTLFSMMSSYSFAKTTLKISTIGHSGDIRKAFYAMAYEFERLNPGVKVEFIIKSDTRYKADLPVMLKEKGAVDIAIWHAGERLNYYIKQGLVLPITQLWSDNDLNKEFTKKIKNIVTYKGDNWAIPTSYYQWGFYYKKSLFKQVGVTAPDDWQQFIKLLNKLKQQNLAPIYIGSKNLWPIGCWFEYLNLRVNGFDYHRAFVNGEVSAYDHGIKQVLTYWQGLINSGYFFENHQGRDLADGFPLIYRGHAAMVLSGHMIESYMSENVIDDIGFFPFPIIKSDIANIQVSPVNVMFIAKSSTNQEIAKKFILFAANKNVQSKLNANLNQFPANKHSMVFGNSLLLSIMASFNRADGLTYFFDREVEEKYGQDNLTIWRDFLEKPTIESTLVKMEKARLDYVARKASQKAY